MRSSSSRRTKLRSSPAMSSTSTAVTALTDRVRARRFAPPGQGAVFQTLPPEGIAMTQHSHQTAPTQFADAAGIRFAYRRFGKSGGVPLVLNMHFTGTMDHWDPLVTDGLAATREVIVFNNAGISSSSGEVPSSAEEMAANAAAFIRALGLAKVDALGFSLGGFVAQGVGGRRTQSGSPLDLGGDRPAGRTGDGDPGTRRAPRCLIPSTRRLPSSTSYGVHHPARSRSIARTAPDGYGAYRRQRAK